MREQQKKEVIKLDHEILNLEEAAEYLRMNPEVFRRMVKKGEIPGRKIGRLWKFSKQLLQKFVEGGNNESVDTGRENRE